MWIHPKTFKLLTQLKPGPFGFNLQSRFPLGLLWLCLSGRCLFLTNYNCHPNTAWSSHFLTSFNSSHSSFHLETVANDWHSSVKQMDSLLTWTCPFLVAFSSVCLQALQAQTVCSHCHYHWLGTWGYSLHLVFALIYQNRLHRVSIENLVQSHQELVAC